MLQLRRLQPLMWLLPLKLVVAGMMLWAQLANFVSLPPLLGALPGSHTWVVDHLVAQRMLTLLEDHCII